MSAVRCAVQSRTVLRSKTTYSDYGIPVDDDGGASWDGVARTKRQKVNIMRQDMTRSRLIQVWFAAVALIVVAGIALGAAVTIGTGAMLLGLCLVPPMIILMLWPGVQTPTIAQVLHDTRAGVDRNEER